MVDALNDLRRELTNALRSVWKNLPTENAPQADALPDDVVEEIAINFYRDPKNRGKLNEDKTDSLPMLARIRSRGLFEDDWRARPTEDRPWPVVLVHGTGSTKGDWQDLGADLRRDGWAVFAPEFGQRATGSVAESSAQIGAYIDTVLLATGASKVIVVGHSQGGVLLRYWMRVLGGASKVKHMVSLAVPNHGTTMGGIVSPLIRNNRGESVVNSVVQSEDNQRLEVVEIPKVTEIVENELKKSEILVSLEEAEKKHIINVMGILNNNVRKAASILGVSERTLQRRLKKIRED